MRQMLGIPETRDITEQDIRRAYKGMPKVAQGVWQQVLENREREAFRLRKP